MEFGLQIDLHILLIMLIFLNVFYISGRVSHIALFTCPTFRTSCATDQSMFRQNG